MGSFTLGGCKKLGLYKKECTYQGGTKVKRVVIKRGFCTKGYCAKGELWKLELHKRGLTKIGVV